jgi:hypothetical protein
MKRHLLVAVIATGLLMGAFLVACEDHNEYHQKDWATPKDDHENASDRPEDAVNCEEYNYVVESCFDACSCCFFGQEENVELCVQDCDVILNQQYADDIEPTKADYHRFTQCVLGCVSLCQGEVEDGACWDECKHHLGLY